MTERLVIVGVGLIGGSFALALRAGGYAGHVVGAGRSAERLQVALDLGVIDAAETDLARAVENADVVMLSVPMLTMRGVLEQLKPGLGPDTIITDAGSTKASFVRDAEAVLDDLSRIVPGHPIAGDERSGVEAARESLFRDRRVILTPLASSAPRAVEKIRSLWQLTGAEVETLDVATHDRVLAATSHLPHILAFGLVDTLARMHEEGEVFRYAAGGFRDFTRIAASDPTMWRDICIANREQLHLVLQHYQRDLRELAALIDAGDADGLRELFSRAKRARDEHCP